MEAGENPATMIWETDMRGTERGHEQKITGGLEKLWEINKQNLPGDFRKEHSPVKTLILA